MDTTDALARLERMIGATFEPIIDPNEILAILAEGRRPDAARNDRRNDDTAPLRTATTLYAPGDLVRQAAGIERWWVCEWAGTTAAVAPSWPTFRIPRTDTTVVDGTVIWADAGSRWQPTYDFNAMAAAGWEAKAAALAHRFTFATDGQTFNVSQLHAQCLTMADRYRRRITGTTQVLTS